MAYTVKKGDTLGAIAKANGMSLTELLKLNPGIKNPDQIGIGQSINISTTTASGTGTTTTTATNATTAAWKGHELNNVPGKPEVWQIDGKAYLVYMVPGTQDDPVYMRWSAPSTADVQSWFGPGKKIVYDRTVTAAQVKKMGVLDFGSTDELANQTEDPFAGWKAELEMQATTQPWILDDDYQALMAQALLEDRAVSEAEIKTTKWWQSHSKGQRDWMVLYHGDPESAQETTETNRSVVRDMIRGAGGGTGVSDEVINYIASQYTQGNWTQTYMKDQVRAVTDKSSGITIDTGLGKLKTISSVTQTVAEEDTVREALSTWLGPAMGNWDQSEITRVAGLIRNDPNYEQRFLEQLKDQRMAALPMYTDRETSYAAIASTWKNWWLGKWGEMPDEKDDLFNQVLRNNDTVESGKLLIREGLNRGNAKTVSDFNEKALGLTARVRAPIG